jgi:hydroxyacylglutathione hydrolase
MILKQYHLACLSHMSYLVGDEATGRGVIVDPRRDIGDYLTDARSFGLAIEGVINTHLHADFVAGHLELAAATGAWIGMGVAAQTDYPIRRLAHREHLSLGRVDLEILATPGHTWESISVLVRERAHALPSTVLTGDSLFIGGVGRPDLVNPGDGSATKLARAMYRSLHEQLLRLPDDVLVMPAHGAGSACGKHLSTELSSTIGEQRRSNPALQPMTRDAFVALVTDGQPAAPAYFSVDAALNRHGHQPLDQSRRIPAMPERQLRAALGNGLQILDARGADDFAAQHLQASINVGFDGRFAETAGMVIDIGEKVALISYPGQAQRAALRLARIGCDNTIGYFAVARHGEFARPLCDLVRAAPRISTTELDRLLADKAVTLIDVRNFGERAAGTIAGAVHVPLAQLKARMREVPTGKPIVVHCASGFRSSAAASLLRANGFENVRDLVGGYNRWAQEVETADTSAPPGINDEATQISCKPDHARSNVQMPAGHGSVAMKKEKSMTLRLGDLAPDFDAQTTEGLIRFHEWVGDSWAVLFSHPKNYTPVCTTELGYMAKIKHEFDRRGVKIIGLSVDPVAEHAGWARDIAATQGIAPNYPLIGDADLTVAKLYDMLPANASGDPADRSAADNQTVRNVYVIGPDKKIKLTLVYPMTTGRNFDEVLRVLDSLQLTASHKVATPVNWRPGEDVIIATNVTDEEARRAYPRGWQAPRPYLRIVAQPSTNEPTAAPLSTTK